MKMFTCKFVQDEVTYQRAAGRFKKSVQTCSEAALRKSRSHFYARSVCVIREHGKMATCLREAAPAKAGNAAGCPQLSLSYDSGAGNGPFGFGWSLALFSITRKTGKGLPRYLDAEESDVFILSGAENLVPVLNDDGTRWSNTRSVDGVEYRIHRNRPRIEGLFARIERWTNLANPSDVYWRSISKNNILILYGKDANSRVADPQDPRPHPQVCIRKGRHGLIAIRPEPSRNASGSNPIDLDRSAAMTIFIGLRFSSAPTGTRNGGEIRT